MYHRVRKKMLLILSAILLIRSPQTLSKSIDPTTTNTLSVEDNIDNQIIDFDDQYAIKFDKKYSADWQEDNFKDTHRYTIVTKDRIVDNNSTSIKITSDSIIKDGNITDVDNKDENTTPDYSVIPLELLSTTQDPLDSIIDSTIEPDLTVIPLSTTHKIFDIKIDETVTLPTTEEGKDTDVTELSNTEITTEVIYITDKPNDENSTIIDTTTEIKDITSIINDKIVSNKTSKNEKILNNSTEATKTNLEFDSNEEDVPIFTELDTEERQNVPEDYYDGKDVIPTVAPKTDAISVLFGLAGSMVESVVESVAEKVVPKTIFDLFKRMQRQNEAMEVERLRSREENGGLGQFGRGILKTISTGLKPLSQLISGGKEGGSLDTDRGFISTVNTGVSNVANVANSLVDAFKDKVQAIYPGTVWCGDGHSATARSGSELGLFFFTDTCCRQHDACKIYIRAGETKYGLTNTGLFTRSHCACDAMFRDCLKRTSSLVSAQIGLTYFNVLSPQCFRRAHPIVKCLKRTRITGQKCEEYELDYTKPKMWQWFDSETF